MGGAKKRGVVEQEKRMLSKTFSLELIWHQRLEVVVHLQPKSQDFLAVEHPTSKIISTKWEMAWVYILKNVAPVVFVRHKRRFKRTSNGENFFI